MSGHYRIVTTLRGEMLIQREHFATPDDAEEYLRRANCLVDGESYLVVLDADRRIYPIWRANRPAKSAAVSLPGDEQP